MRRPLSDPLRAASAARPPLVKGDYEALVKQMEHAAKMAGPWFWTDIMLEGAEAIRKLAKIGEKR